MKKNVPRPVEHISLPEDSKIHDKKRHLKIKIILAMIVIVILSAVSVVLIYSSMLDDVKQSHETIISEYKDEQFENLWSVLTQQLKCSAKNNILDATNEIEYEIRNTDMGILKSELDKGIYSDELMNIFKNNLRDVCLNNIDNGRNNTIVISNDYMILNYSYYAYPNHAENSHSFTSILQSGFNKELNEDAIDRLYKQDDSIICIEMEPSSNNNHIKISESTKQNFKKVYMAEGIDGFKNYQFLVPIYITDTGDVFGQDDIVHGERTDKNHKFIIIQEFNLYDQVSQYPEYFDNSYLNELNYHFDSMMKNFYILGILFIIFVIIIIFTFIAIYNNFIYGYLLAVHSEEEIDEEK